jgi:hypothetical protein
MIFEVKVFFSSQNIDFPFYLRRLLAFFFFSFFSFSYAPSLEDLGFLMIFEEKIILQKPLFKWHDMEWHGHNYEYTDGGRIF